MKPTLIIIVSLIVVEETSSKELPIRYVDYENDIDTQFDRLVMIYEPDREKEGNFHYRVTGVLITDNLILTSFNPFRKISTNSDTLSNMEVHWITKRVIGEQGQTVSYDDDTKVNRKIKCARQVIPPLTSDILSIDMQHGHHSPLHDLMVIRLEEPVKFVDPVPPVMSSSKVYKDWSAYNLFGPIKTILGGPDDLLFKDILKFASIGHLDDDHITENYALKLGEFGDVADCDEWMPREWGLLICLENTKNYPGLASGAMLFSQLKLLGVGAFMLQKEEKRSILVFSDVRPYSHILNQTCTEDDQKLQEPEIKDNKRSNK